MFTALSAVSFPDRRDHASIATDCSEQTYDELMCYQSPDGALQTHSSCKRHLRACNLCLTSH